MAGRPVDVSDAAILSVVSSLGDPWVATGDVADELPIGHNAVYRRLVKLEDSDRLESRRFGNSLAWRLTDAGREYLEEEG